MLLENLIPLVIVSVVIFGVLWFVLEAAALLGGRKS
jgi:NADH:ubiquinone oxidoreductase subunit 3 (subunit A)